MGLKNVSVGVSDFAWGGDLEGLVVDWEGVRVWGPKLGLKIIKIYVN